MEKLKEELTTSREPGQQHSEVKEDLVESCAELSSQIAKQTGPSEGEEVVDSIIKELFHVVEDRSSGRDYYGEMVDFLDEKMTGGQTLRPELQPTNTSSCLPSKYVVETEPGRVVPTARAVADGLAIDCSLRKGEQDVTMESVERLERTETLELVATSTPTETGETTENILERLTKGFSPLAPRVDTWRGLSEVKIVPDNVGVQSLNKNIADTSREWENVTREHSLWVERTSMMSEEEEESEEMDALEPRRRLAHIDYNIDVTKDGVAKEWWSTTGGHEIKNWRGGTEEFSDTQEVEASGEISTSERDNRNCEGAETGPTKSAPAISPHVPRVDTGRGLSEVNVVPADVKSKKVTEMCSGVMEGRGLISELVEDSRTDSSEPSNLRLEGESEGSNELAQGISPLVRRVDTWRGLDTVNIVPVVEGIELIRDEQATINTDRKEAGQDGAETETEEDGENQEKESVEEGKTGPQTDTTETHRNPCRLHTPPSAESRSRSNNEQNNRNSKQAENSRKFYWRRRRRRLEKLKKMRRQENEGQQAEQSNSCPDVNAPVTCHQSNSKKTHFKIQSNSKKTHFKILTGISDLIMAGKEGNSPNEALNVLIEEIEKEEGEGTAREMKQVEILVDHTKEGEKLQESKEDPKPNKKKVKKTFTCDKCEKTFGWKGRLDTHKEKEHGIMREKKPRQLPKPRGLDSSGGSASASSSSGSSATPICLSSDASPELMQVVPGVVKTSKRKAEEETILQSQALRQKLQNLHVEAMAEEAEENKPAGKAKGAVPVTMTEQLLDAYKKSADAEKLLSVQAQEAAEYKMKCSTLQFEKDALLKEVEDWRKQAELIINTSKNMEKIKAELKDAEARAERWKFMGQEQFIYLDDVKKSLIAAKEKAKYLENRTECRDYAAGRCKRPAGTCKFAHVLATNSNAQMKTQLEQGMGAVGTGEEREKVGDNICVHYERGYCRNFNNCSKVHIPENYGSRPRSGSHGSNQGFQGRPRTKVGNLGTLNEEEKIPLPTMTNPDASRETVRTMVEMLDTASRSSHSASEKMIQDQLKEIRNLNLVMGTQTTDSMKAAFRSKRD